MRGLVTWLVLLCCAAPASAQPQDYEGLIREGLAEYAAGRWAQARVLFARAHDERPSARTLRGLGMVDFNLGAYARAAAELEAALASPSLALQGALREHAGDLLWRANRFVAHVRVQLQPATAVLTVDGDVPSLDQRGDAILELGSHLIRAQSPAHVTAERTLKIELPVASVLSLTLEHEPPPAPAPTAPPPSRLRPWAWASSVAATALVVGGVVTWLVSDRRYRELEQECEAKVCASAPAGSEAVTRLDRASQTLWAAGAGFGVGATVLWTLERRDARTRFALAQVAP